MFRYEINQDTFEVSGYASPDGSSEVNCLLQPTWPNGEAFSSVEDARLFGESWLTFMLDPQYRAMSHRDDKDLLTIPDELRTLLEEEENA